jgi:hypothetical protein
MGLYLRGKHDELSEALLAVLWHFRDTTYHTLDAQGRHFVNEFVKAFLHLFTQSDYVPGGSHLAEFVRLNLTISNLVALSAFGTTDPYLELLRDQPGALGKTLSLLSARNAFAFRRESFFEADPVLANVWYGAYAGLYRSGLVRGDVLDRLRDHFDGADARLDARFVSLDSYFASTYVGGGCDRAVKAALNRSVKHRAAVGGAHVRNTPVPRKVAVISGNWSPEHSVYRILHAYLKALQGYRLALFHLGRKGEPDARLFDEVHRIDPDRDGLFGPLLDNDFSAVIYPDAGLSWQGVCLANVRIAPVQLAMLGHSVSTFGAEVDYFVSGADVEPPDHPERNYSERLVLLPGCGAVHERPDYTPAGRRKSTDSVLINAPWNAQKVNHAFALTLRELVRRSERPVRLRLFAGASLSRQNDYLPFVRDLEALLGPQHVEVLTALPYPDYMALMEEGDLTLDSFPFGGCNTVADSLFLHKLTVCREGDAWFNRIGPRMLRMVGLPELAAGTDGEYVEAALRLIRDDAYRSGLQAHLDRSDLDATIFCPADARYFPEALAYLIANHDRLRTDPDRSPIRIGA